MDRTEEDMKFVGSFGIFKQSFKILFSWKKIFSQITFAFILPLAIIFVVYRKISTHIFWKIDNNSLPFDTYDSRESTSMEWLYYSLFTIAYFIFLTFFSLLATATIVFTFACIYTSREVAFRKVIKVIPKVWKRLCITFIFMYIAQFICGVIASVALGIFVPILGFSILGFSMTFIIVLITLYGFLYLSVVCQLASVVTVLENVHGFNALRKGKDLVKGKKMLGMEIAFALYGFLVVLIAVYISYVEKGPEGYSLALIWRVLIGILCGIVFLMLFLLIIVTQTVLYLVCKSYHREAIDKLSLSTFLGAYMGETMVYSGMGEEIQLGITLPETQQV